VPRKPHSANATAGVQLDVVSFPGATAAADVDRLRSHASSAAADTVHHLPRWTAPGIVEATWRQALGA
jgi:hypothetical protein